MCSNPSSYVSAWVGASPRAGLPGHAIWPTHLLQLEPPLIREQLRRVHRCHTRYACAPPARSARCAQGGRTLRPDPKSDGCGLPVKLHGALHIEILQGMQDLRWWKRGWTRLYRWHPMCITPPSGPGLMHTIPLQHSCKQLHVCLNCCLQVLRVPCKQFTSGQGGVAEGRRRPHANPPCMAAAAAKESIARMRASQEERWKSSVRQTEQRIRWAAALAMTGRHADMQGAQNAK